MKSTLEFLLVIMASLAISAQFAAGQATFTVRNYGPGVGLDAPVFDAEGNRLAGTNYAAVLFGGATMDSLRIASAGAGEMSPVPFTATYNSEAGYFSRAGFVYVDNAPCAGIAWLQVRVWDMRLGSSYDEVAALGLGGYGESSLFRAQGGDGCSVTGLPPQPLIGLQSFSLVPEPNTWALLGFGVGCLLWRWRRSG